MPNLKASMDQNLPLRLEQFFQGERQCRLFAPQRHDLSSKSLSLHWVIEAWGMHSAARDSGKHVGSPCGVRCRQRFWRWRKEMQEAQVRPGQKACSSLAHQVMTQAGQGQTQGWHLQRSKLFCPPQRGFCGGQRVGAGRWSTADRTPSSYLLNPPVSGYSP